MASRIVMIGGPWPERIGCEGTTVDAPPAARYPWSKLGKSNAVVLLDDDPLACAKFGCDHSQTFFLTCREHPEWSCVVDVSALAFEAVVEDV